LQYDILLFLYLKISEKNIKKNLQFFLFRVIDSTTKEKGGFGGEGTLFIFKDLKEDTE
jgi:hypothetical protein